MKDEFTEKMHSEFTVSKEAEISLKVGSAIQIAILLDKHDRESFEEVLSNYDVTYNDYLKWKEDWSRLGLNIYIS